MVMFSNTVIPWKSRALEHRTLPSCLAGGWEWNMNMLQRRQIVHFVE